MTSWQETGKWDQISQMTHIVFPSFYLIRLLHVVLCVHVLLEYEVYSSNGYRSKSWCLIIQSTHAII